MTLYSQKDPRWANTRLGSSRLTIGGYGCAITALGILAGKTPLEVNQILLDGGGFAQGNLVIWGKAAELLGLPFDPTTSSEKFRPCLIETDHFAPGTPQHFAVLLPSGKIADPLDGKIKVNYYRIKSYRNIGEKGASSAMTNDEAWDLVNASYEVLFGRSLTETEGHERTWTEVREIQKLGPKAGDWLRTKAASPEAKIYRFSVCPPPQTIEIPVEKVVEREVKVPADQMSASEHLAWAVRRLLGL